MAAFLSVFHPASPIIRRRAKELLDAIRNAVKGALAPAPTSSSAEAATSTREEEVAMSVDEKVIEVVTASVSSVASTSLWTNGNHSSASECGTCCMLTPRNSIRYHSIFFDAVRSVFASARSTGTSNSATELATWWNIKCYLSALTWTWFSHCLPLTSMLVRICPGLLPIRRGSLKPPPGSTVPWLSLRLCRGSWPSRRRRFRQTRR